MTPRPDTQRSIKTQARLGCFIPGALEEIPVEKVYSVSGYWRALYFYGPVSRDAAAMLGRYLSEAKRQELAAILDASDKEAEDA